MGRVENKYEASNFLMESTISWQAKVRKRRATKNTPESEASAAIYDKPESVVVNDAYRFAASKLNEERKDIMSKLINQMSAACSIYDSEFRNLAQKHEPGAGKLLRWKVGVVLSDPSCKVEGIIMTIMPSIMSSDQIIWKTGPRLWKK